MMIGRSLQDYEEQKPLTGIWSPNSSVKNKTKQKKENKKQRSKELDTGRKNWSLLSNRDLPADWRILEPKDVLMMAGASVRCEVTSRRATNRRMPDATMRAIRSCRMWIFLGWCLKHELLTNRDQFAVRTEIRMAGPRDSFPEDALHHRYHGVVIALLHCFRCSKRRRKKERKESKKKNVSSPFEKVIYYCSPVQLFPCSTASVHVVRLSLPPSLVRKTHPPAVLTRAWRRPPVCLSVCRSTGNFRNENRHNRKCTPQTDRVQFCFVAKVAMIHIKI